MNRAIRLQERFLTIQQTLAELYGKEKAFAAASAGWLMALQYAALQSMKRIQREVEAEEGPCFVFASGSLIDSLDAEHEAMLRGFHAEICKHLNVDPAEAVKLSEAFEQVVDDICKQKG